MDAPSAAPLLAHERVGAADAAASVWFLHGIFGAGRNWGTVARRLAERRPEWAAVLVDLRQHGESRGLPPPHDLERCAEDLERLARDPGLRPSAVVGHSFGGKVALAWAGGAPAGLRQLWVVDVSPSAGRPGGTAGRMLRAVRALPERFPTRDEAVSALVERGFERPVATWMATNLERADGGFRWRFDADAMEALLADFHRRDLWMVLEAPPDGLEVRIVRATRSDAIPAEEARRIEELAAGGAPVRLHRVEGGHWLNADAPEAMVDLLSEGLPGA